MFFPTIKKIEAAEFKRQLLCPFITSGFSLYSREGIIIRATFCDETVTYGEASPLAPFSLEKIGDVKSFLIEEKKNNWISAYAFGERKLLSSLAMAVDSITYDYALSKNTNCISSLELNAVFSLGAGSLKKLRELYTLGYTTFKLKISPANSVQTLSFLRAAYKEFKDSIKFRLDANASFPFVEAKKFLAATAIFPLEYIEDILLPSNINQYEELAENTKTPLALDMGLNTKAAIENAIEIPWTSFLILKPTACGGLLATQSLLEKIQKKNKVAILTSLLETEVGLRSLINYSLPLNKGNYAYGFSTASIFAENFLPIPPNIKKPLSFNENLSAWLRSLPWEAVC